MLYNYKTAFARTHRTLLTLQTKPNIAKAYDDAIQDYLKTGVIEEVFDERAKLPERRDVYYLPHCAVYDETRLSTKCRIVFDASAKTPSGISLNQCLLAGPPLQAKILAVEVMFRLRKYALIGDISKMLQGR